MLEPVVVTATSTTAEPARNCLKFDIATGCTCSLSTVFRCGFVSMVPSGVTYSTRCSLDITSVDLVLQPGPIVNCREGVLSSSMLKHLGAWRDLHSEIETSGHIIPEFLELQRVIWDLEPETPWSLIVPCAVLAKAASDEYDSSLCACVVVDGKSCCNSLRRSGSQGGITFVAA